MVMPCLPNKRGEVYRTQSCYRWHLSHSGGYLLFAPPHTRLPIWGALGPPGCELVAGANRWGVVYCGELSCVCMCVSGGGVNTSGALGFKGGLCLFSVSYSFNFIVVSFCHSRFWSVHIVSSRSLTHSPSINTLWLAGRQVGRAVMCHITTVQWSSAHLFGRYRRATQLF